MKKQIRKLIGMYGGWGILTVIAVYVFQLTRFSAWSLFLLGIFLLPVIWYGDIRRYWSEKEFHEMTGYMEQLMCSYRREKTILDSLEDCRILYVPGSRMETVLSEAVEKLHGGVGNEKGTVISAAFQRIESFYPSKRLKMLHSFLENVSCMGGEYRGALDILLRDLQLWKQRVILHQKKRMAIRQEETVTVFFAVVFCFLSRKIMPDYSAASIVPSIWYQGSLVVTGALFLVGEAFVNWQISKSWCDYPEKSEKKRQRQLRRAYEYIMQHTGGIRYYMAVQLCRKEIQQEFPYWILTVTLYLQQDSVYQSVLHSMEEQGAILQQEIQKLLKNIYDMPDSVTSYLKFCEFANIPELQTIMKLLYGINTNGVEDTKRQILFLVEQNCFVVSQTEETLLTRKLWLLEFLKQYPMVVGGIKIVYDLFLFLQFFMKDMQYYI
ncbi:MAG: hypothetical protein J5988_08860 [Eubacterium sp.]|nr:hypothetical protein [Eubacterium sp.]